MLRPNYTPRFKKDIKSLKKKHVDLRPLIEVMQLIIVDTPKAKTELKRRHNMHVLKGDWHGSLECHVANAGDWLLIWATNKEQAYFQRTGSHDELFA
jgi:mRNA interferase YafQ